MRNVLIALLAVLIAQLAGAQAPPVNRTIDSTGTATVYVKPDKIYIGIGVESFDPSLDAATSANDAAIARVVKALRDLGVEEKNIRTEEMNVDLQYRDSSHASKGVEGYFARKNLTVEVDTSAMAERVVTAALHSGANRVLGIRYDTSQLRKYRDQARETAAKAAREKAELIAGTLGARVGAPITIREGYSSNYGSYSYWNYGYGYYTTAAAQQNVSVAGGGGGGGDESQIVPAGQMAVRADIYVTFELMPK